ncbi:MAG: hypothetical protein WA957_04280 [Alteraurantiacibacter sp.]
MAQGRLVAAILAGLALAMASGLSFIWNTGRTASGVVDLGGLAAHPQRSMDAATLAFRRDRGKLDQVDHGQLDAALAQAPLEAAPFVYAGAQLANAGRLAEAERLLDIATHRNPRSREARALLLQNAMASGNGRAAVTQIEVMYRLQRDERPVLSEALIYLASMPETRPSTLAAISDNRHRRDVLQGMARWGASPAMLISAKQALGDLDLGRDRDDFVRSLVNSLLAIKDWSGARRVWSTYYPDATDRSGLVVDPSFTGQFGPPFGWTVQSAPNGEADLGESGLTGRYSGSERAELARQLVLADPGQYRLSIKSADTGNGLWIEVACAGSTAIAEQQVTAGSQGLNVTVGSDCRALDVMILARPSALQSSQGFRLTSLQMERIGS